MEGKINKGGVNSAPTERPNVEPKGSKPNCPVCRNPNNEKNGVYYPDQGSAGGNGGFGPYVQAVSIIQEHLPGCPVMSYVAQPHGGVKVISIAVPPPKSELEATGPVTMSEHNFCRIVEANGGMGFGRMIQLISGIWARKILKNNPTVDANTALMMACDSNTWARDNNKLEKLLKEARREIEVLRHYGNKTCTAMADDRIAEMTKKDEYEL